MSRPMALGLVLLVLILTSQSDWKQDTRTELDESSSTATKQEDALLNREVVKKEVSSRVFKVVPNCKGIPADSYSDLMCVILSHYVLALQIILMQEKEIHDLKLQLKSLEEKLKQCQCEVPDNTTVKASVLEQADTELNSKKELVESVAEKATKNLRGSVRPSRGLDLFERPSELPALDDALDLADDDEKIGDR